MGDDDSGSLTAVFLSLFAIGAVVQLITLLLSIVASLAVVAVGGGVVFASLGFLLNRQVVRLKFAQISFASATEKVRDAYDKLDKLDATISGLPAEDQKKARDAAITFKNSILEAFHIARQELLAILQEISQSLTSARDEILERAHKMSAKRFHQAMEKIDRARSDVDDIIAKTTVLDPEKMTEEPAGAIIAL